MPIRVLHVGLGPIGLAVVRQVAERSGLQTVGGVDVDPAKHGKDLLALAGLARRGRVPITGDLDGALSRARPQVAVVCTGSSLHDVWPQLEALLLRGVAVVSTTEELAYPVGANRRLAKRLDRAAKAGKAAVLGTGVNPGFAMDALPIALTAVCQRVDAIRVDRVQDARIRRLPFQVKIGAGLTRAQFRQRVEGGQVRHVGLAESVQMIADALSWPVDRITDDIRPKVTRVPLQGEHLPVAAGRVCGLVQEGVGWVRREPRIVLHMEAYLGAPATFDAVTIEGSPRVHSRIDGGVHGDIATASIVVNTIPKLLTVAPGLHTMRDMPLPSYA